MATSSLIDIPYKRFEIELTSRCNAACPGCRRTVMKHHGSLVIEDISFETIEKTFDNINLENAMIYLCGTLGDPLVHPEIEDICEFFVFKGVKQLNVHTNGGMRTPDFWHRMGQLTRLAQRNHQDFNIQWNVDGGPETNHIYRVNVNWDRLWKNMNAFSEAHGNGEWCFIEFDWNKDDLEWARQKAKELNFSFTVRRAWRNKKKEEKQGVVQFSRGEQVFENDYSLEQLDCKHLNKPELFLSCDNRVFPCCYLKDESTKEDGRFDKIYENYGENFNSLLHNNFTDIIQHEWLNGQITESSMNVDHPMFLKRCFVTCGGKGKRLTQIEKIDNRFPKNEQ